MKSPVGLADCHATSSSLPSSVISPLRRTAVATLRCDVSCAAVGGGAAGGVCALSEEGSAERDTKANELTRLRRISNSGSYQDWTHGARDWFIWTHPVARREFPVFLFCVVPSHCRDDSSNCRTLFCTSARYDCSD